MEKKGTELFEILNIELNNRDVNDKNDDPINIKILPDPANFEINFSSPLHLRAGGSCMVTDAYLSFFDGQTVEPGNIIIERDYSFTMGFCLLWTNTVDNLPTAYPSPPVDVSAIPIGYTSILTDSGAPVIQNVNINIKAGSYSPSSLVELFNRQTLVPSYLSNAKDGKIYNPPANASIYGNSLPFNTMAQFLPSDTTFELYKPGISPNFDPDYGYQITSVVDTTHIFYSIPMTQPLIYGSNGFTINFDENTQRFNILSNFMPITSTDSNSLVVLRMNDPVTAGGRVFIDRTGEVLVQNWGYKISEWKNSFWYRLGFEFSDLIKTSPTDKNLFGRVYADINNLAVNQSTNPAYESDGLKALNLQQGAILMESTGDNAYKAMSYDGNNLPIFASKSPNLIPLGYCRARLDLQIVGGGSNGSNLYGFTQAISLLNISQAGITSFSILNPCPFMFASDMVIKSIRVFLQDPRNDERLTWISKQNLSALFLRIQQPLP